MENAKELHKSALASVAFLFQQLEAENEKLKQQAEALQQQLEQYRKALPPEELSRLLQMEQQ